MQIGETMTYEQAITYIHDTYRFGSKLGLDNIERLLTRLGRPDHALKVIHIAGTNGKGSTASFIAQVLTQSGYRVGKYISPYLETFNERIQIDSVPIKDQELALHTSAVKTAVDDMMAQGYDHPTEFEIVTAIGWLYFKAQDVDFVVLEVGLGGRLDSTNVIESPLVCAITPVSMDHTQYLGHTLEAIAFEKAGIIKKNVPLVITQQSQEAMETIMAQANKMKAPYHIADHRGAVIHQMGFEGTRFTYKSDQATYSDVKIRLLGKHQVQNAVTAIRVLEVLKDKGVCLKDDAIQSGLEATEWPGRFEKVSDDPCVIIDGAHNTDAVEKLIEAIHVYQPNGRRVAVFGMMADKAVEDVLALLGDAFDAFYLVKPDNPRAMPPQEIRTLLLKLGYKGDIHILSQIGDILPRIESFKSTNQHVYVFGSLYYIGEVRRLIRESALKSPL